MPGRRLNITRCVVNTVTSGWVGVPNRRALRADFMTQSLVSPIDVCRELGISPFSKHSLSFSQADLGLTSAQE